MTKKIEVKIYNNENDTFELECEKIFKSLQEENCKKNTLEQPEIFDNGQMADFEIIGEENLTYNEIENLTELSNILAEFYDVCAAAVVKNAAPCAVALAADIQEVCNKVFDCDPTSLFDATIGFTQKINSEIAKQLISMPVKLILAVEIDNDALELIKSDRNKKIAILKTKLEEFNKLEQQEIRITPFGTIYKNRNDNILNKESFNVVTKTKPTKEQIEDTVFAWKISKFTHSNSMVVAKDFKTTAITQGSVSAAGAVEAAMDTSCDCAKDAIMASDIALDTPECIYAAAQGRISAIIQPGGHQNDTKLINLADKYNIAMIFTGINNYKR